jgi:hypothetical protein
MVRSSVAQIIATGKVVKPVLGISFAPDAASEQLGVKGGWPRRERRAEGAGRVGGWEALAAARRARPPLGPSTPQQMLGAAAGAGQLGSCAARALRFAPLRPDPLARPLHAHRRTAARGRGGSSPRRCAAAAPLAHAALSPAARAGILVLSARDDGPAFKAGIMGTSRDSYGRLVLGDIITGVNGQVIKKSSDLYKILDKCAVGERLEVEVLRGDATQRLPVVLESSEAVPLTEAKPSRPEMRPELKPVVPGGGEQEQEGK